MLSGASSTTRTTGLLTESISNQAPSHFVDTGALARGERFVQRVQLDPRELEIVALDACLESLQRFLHAGPVSQACFERTHAFDCGGVVVLDQFPGTQEQGARRGVSLDTDRRDRAIRIQCCRRGTQRDLVTTLQVGDPIRERAVVAGEHRFEALRGALELTSADVRGGGCQRVRNLHRALGVTLGARGADVSHIFDVSLEESLEQSAIGRLVAIDSGERRT